MSTGPGETFPRARLASDRVRVGGQTWRPRPPQLERTPLQRRIDRARARLDRPLRADRRPAGAPGRLRDPGPRRTRATSRRLASNLKDGLSNGAIWALIALGYTLVYGIIQLINFAHGELFMIGSFTAVGLYGDARARHRQPGDRARRRAAGGPRGRDDRVRSAQRDDRARRVPAVTPRAEARAADHGGRASRSSSRTSASSGSAPAQQAAPDLIKSQKELFDIAGVSITQGDVLAIAATAPLLLLLGAFVTRSRIGQGDARDVPGSRRPRA